MKNGGYEFVSVVDSGAEIKPVAFLEIFEETEVGAKLFHVVHDAPQGHLVTAVRLRIVRLRDGCQQGLHLQRSREAYPVDRPPVGEDEIRAKPGQLVKVTETLTAANIDIRAMSLADTQDFGILRLIVNDTQKALSILRDGDYLVQITEVVGVKLSDQPGALAKALDVLDKDDVNLEYLYAFLSSEPGTARVVLRVADNIEAARILTKNGFEII